jgi:hypothetical protein
MKITATHCGGPGWHAWGFYWPFGKERYFVNANVIWAEWRSADFKPKFLPFRITFVINDTLAGTKRMWSLPPVPKHLIET